MFGKEVVFFKERLPAFPESEYSLGYKTLAWGLPTYANKHELKKENRLQTNRAEPSHRTQPGDKENTRKLTPSFVLCTISCLFKILHPSPHLLLKILHHFCTKKLILYRITTGERGKFF